MVNKIDDGSATLDFKDFCLVIKEKIMDMDTETHFKDTFRVFSKDEEGKREVGEGDLQMLQIIGVFITA